MVQKTKDNFTRVLRRTVCDERRHQDFFFATCAAANYHFIEFCLCQLGANGKFVSSLQRGLLSFIILVLLSVELCCYYRLNVVPQGARRERPRFESSEGRKTFLAEFGI